MHIRVVSRRPTQPPPSPSGCRINGILSSAADVQVFLQDAEGKETLLTNVKGVEWSARGGEPLTCKIELYDVELDVEAEVFEEGTPSAQEEAARQYREACARFELRAKVGEACTCGPGSVSHYDTCPKWVLPY